jgi:16S rRNA (cytosine967-C5)-methyltransferase
MPERGRDGLAARTVALGVLRRIEQTAAYADVALDAALRSGTLPPRDRALASRLAYGTVAWQRRLDWHLAQLTHRDAATLDVSVRLILRLGLYQLLCLDRVPPHAAVSTSVDLAKREAPAAAGLVNAVLRRATRDAGKLSLPDPAVDPVRHLGVAFSHPDWLVERWRTHLGHDEAARLLAADNDAAPTVLRARRGRRDELIAELASSGVRAVAGEWAPDAVRVDAVAPHALPGFVAGALTVQSEASQLVVHALGLERGMRVLDVCAAPGGKTTYAAELVGESGRVVAFDRRRSGVAAAVDAARRLRLRNVLGAVADARRPPLGDARFDRILVDAPCSGLGTLRAHPEVRWTRGPDDVRRLAELQIEILDAAAPHLAAGGVLVYSTCTISVEENDDVVARWMARNPDLERESAAVSLPPQARELVDATGALRTFPHRHGLDGFYAVRVRRRS